MPSRRAFLLGVATLIAGCKDYVPVTYFSAGGGNNFPISVPLPPVGQTFDFYISPTGDDNNPGTLAQPWSITALGTVANHTTAACKWTTYTAKRVGILPGTYTYGTYQGVQTQLYNIAEASATMVLVLNGSATATPTYIGACDVHGNQLPGTAAPTSIIDIGYNGIPPDWQTVAIGNSVLNLAFFPPNVGNCTIDGLWIKNFGGWGIAMGDNAHAISQGMTVKNCYLSGGLGFHNDNNGGFYLNGLSGGLLQNCRVDSTYSSTQLFKGACTGYISGTSFTIVSVTQGNIFYPGSSTGLVFNGSPTNSAAPIGANTLPAGVTFNAPSANTPGTYTLSVNCGTVGSAASPVTFYIGFPSSSTKWGAYGCIIYNTNASNGASGAPFTIKNCTFREINLVDYKTTPQNYDVSYSYFETGEFGNTTSAVTPPLTFNAQAVPGGTGKVHHNIFIGGCFLYEAAAPIGNAGSVTCYNNTYYLPSGYNLVSGGSVGNCSYEQNATLSGFTGSSNDYNNLFWQDLAAPLGGTVLVAAPTINVQRDYNAYCGGAFPFTITNGGTAISLANWKTTYSLDTHSISLSSTPFASTPMAAVTTSFALNPGSPAASAGIGGAIVGAIDGTGTVGCSFGGGVITLTTVTLPQATVGTPYSTTITASGGSGNYTFAVTSCSPNFAAVLTGGQPYFPFALAGGVLAFTPVQNETEAVTIQVTDTTTLATASQTYALVVNPQ